MASTLTLTLTSPIAQEQLNLDVRAQLDGKYEQIQDLEALLRAAASGDRALTIAMQFGATVKATGTLTLASVVATDAFAIGGTTLTGVAAAPTTSQFLIGADDEETAQNIAAAIALNPTIAALVTASASAEVVTVTAVAAGTAGNAITLTSADATIAPSAATLLGGVAGISKTIKFNMV